MGRELPPPLRVLRFTVAAAFRLSVTVVTLLLVVLAALPLVQHKALIVTSGSMEPVLSAGDAAIIHRLPVDDLRAGDVITYQGYGSDRLTTHRIVQPIELDSGLHFQTKGDANPGPDPDLAPAGGVVGRYVVGIPGAGRVLLFLAQPQGRLLIVGLPALVVLVGELRFLLAGRVTLRVGRRRGATVAAALMLTSVASVGGVLMATGAVMADIDSVGDNTFSTAATFTP